MKLWVKVENQERRVEVEERNGVYVVEIDGQQSIVDCRTAGHRDYLSLLINNKSYLVESAPTRLEDGLFYATIDGRRYDVEVLDERLVASRQATAVVGPTGPYTVYSPMPGLIVDIRVAVGDTIKAGTALVVMEAMKMQNELVSEIDGVVKEINVKTKDAVDSQAPLIVIERSE